MNKEDDWHREEKIIKFLAEQLLRGRLTIFLGSGLSLASGLPSWEDLLRRLAARIGEPVSANFPLNPNLIQFATRLTEVYNNKAADFICDVRASLYQDAKLDFESLSKDSTLRALGALTMSSARGGVASVITLNYDDVLETYLSNNGFVVHTIFEANHPASRADVTIFHPHGYVPAKTGNGSSNIVLDQSSYSSMIGREENNWTRRIGVLLRESYVLLIGLGSADQNLMTLLSRAHEDHFSKKTLIPYYGVALAGKNEDVSAESTFKSAGVRMHRVEDFHEHLPTILFKICQEAATLRGQEMNLS